MATFDVTVFITKRLYDYSLATYGRGYRPRERATRFINGAFGQSASHSVNVTQASQTPNPPEEGAGGNNTMSGSCICASGTCTWNNLYDWWKSWYNGTCNDPHPEGVDCNLLISRGTGGGLGGGKFAVAATGDNVAKLPLDYQKFGYTDAYRNMRATLHEIGHALMANTVDGDGDGVGEHDSGAVLYDSANNRYAISPMGINGSKNNCNESHNKSLTDTDGDGKPDGWAQFYSTCTQKSFSKK